MLTLRRREFARPGSLGQVLSGARYGHLATLAPTGELELRPLNFVCDAEALYFHCAPKTPLAERGGAPAAFACQDLASWIPSTWRDPELACPATTFYRSAGVRGTLQRIDDLQEKARILEAFMSKYQPEGGHLPLDHERYQAPLKGICVLKLPLQETVCKSKLGQHLSSSAKRTVYQKLVQRGDVEMARAMEMPLEDGWIDVVDPEPVWELLRNTYWAHKRSPEIVQQNLKHARLNLGYLQNGELKAYCRVNEVQKDTAWLFDVVVHPSQRGHGLGTRLIQRMLERLDHARIFLDTRDAMTFYARFGWRELDRTDGRSLMLWKRS